MFAKIGQYFFKFLLAMMLCILLASFTIWGVGDTIRKAGFDDSTAKVGHAKISGREVADIANRQATQMRAILGDAALQPEMMRTFEAAVRDRLVNDMLLAQETDALGLKIPNTIMADFIAKQKPFQADGHFSKELFEQYLRRTGQSEQALVQQLRTDTAAQYILATLSDSSSLSQAYISQLAKRKGEQRIISLLTLPREAITSTAEPTDADLRTYYDHNKKNFAAPEMRSFSFVVVDDSVIKNTDVSISDDEAKEYFDDHASSFDKTFAESKAEIIQNLQADKKADAMQKAVTAMEDALSGGTKLAEIAKQYQLSVKTISQISATGEGANGQPAASDLIMRDALLKQVFSMEAGQAPVTLATEGDDRYVLVALDEVTPARDRALDEVRGLVTDGWKAEAQRDAARKKAEEIATALQAANAEASAKKPLALLSEKAQTLSLEPHSVGPFYSTGPERQSLPEAMLREIFTLQNGQATGAYPQGPNAYVVAVVQDVLPAKQNDPIHGDDMVRAELEKQWRDERVQMYLAYLRQKHDVTLYPLPSERNTDKK